MSAPGNVLSKFCAICQAALRDEQQCATGAGTRMCTAGICAQSGNAGVRAIVVEGFDEHIVDTEQDGSELSIMSISSTLSSDPDELCDLSSPSDLEDNQLYSSNQLADHESEGDVDVDGLGEHMDMAASMPGSIIEPMTEALLEPMSEQLIDQVIETIREQMAEQMQQEQPQSGPQSAPLPNIDLGSFRTDWPTVESILNLYEQRFDELVRVWDLLKTIILLLTNPTLVPATEPMTLPRSVAVAVPALQPQHQLLSLPLPPNANLQSIWSEWPVIQNILDPQRNMSWTAYQQQMEEFIHVAEIFAELIQYELIGHNLL
ncbi:uncharacterized protein LOC115767858 [Drosophila novamexicana]|uniref:uncharacterized protein LOC115767858 n=1 Tax=Drosophila novamexicana TaxID=47314 RepID=UPI0011E5D208|nr:uncharacterized protein LOC115767858 [Drosophila novamexicana]